MYDCTYTYCIIQYLLCLLVLNCMNYLFLSVIMYVYYVYVFMYAYMRMYVTDNRIASWNTSAYAPL